MDAQPLLDPFFFPASPLFGAHDGSAVEADSGAFAAEGHAMLFADGTDHLAYGHPAKASLSDVHSLPLSSLDGRHVTTEFDWSMLTSPPPMSMTLAAGHVPLDHADLLSPRQAHFLPTPPTHYGHQASVGSSSDSSCATTPTCLQIDSPVSQPTSPPAMLAHAPVAASHVAAQQAAPAPHRPAVSLLDQFSCTVPVTVAPSVLARETYKVKREAKGKRAQVTKATKAAAAVAQQQPVQAPAQLAHQSVPQLQLPVFAPSTRAAAAGGYSSDSSSSHPPSSLHSSSPVSSPSVPCCDDSVEPLSTDSDEVRRRKLVRKAELARLARKRKKTRLGDLEGEVARLEAELEAMRKKARTAGGVAHTGTVLDLVSGESDAAQAAQLHAAVERMDQAVRSGLVAQVEQAAAVAQRADRTGADAVSRSAPTPLTPLVDAYMHAVNATQASCQKHLDALAQHHMHPMKTFEFIQWVMKQPHESPSSIWSQLLHRELSLTPSSREYRELECFRQSLSSQHQFDGEVEKAFGKLVQLCQKRATQQAKNLNRIRAILDEQQFCKLMAWMNRREPAADVKMEY